VVLDQPLVPRVLYGNYESPRFVFAARFWPFLPLLLKPMPRIRFNDATPTIGRGAAEAALFRESVERMDRP